MSKHVADNFKLIIDGKEVASFITGEIIMGYTSAPGCNEIPEIRLDSPEGKKIYIAASPAGPVFDESGKEDAYKQLEKRIHREKIIERTERHRNKAEKLRVAYGGSKQLGISDSSQAQLDTYKTLAEEIAQENVTRVHDELMINVTDDYSPVKISYEQDPNEITLPYNLAKRIKIDLDRCIITFTGAKYVEPMTNYVHEFMDTLLDYIEENVSPREPASFPDHPFFQIWINNFLLTHSNLVTGSGCKGPEKGKIEYVGSKTGRWSSSNEFGQVTKTLEDGSKINFPVIESLKPINLYDEYDREIGEPTECFCNVGNAPCSYCEDPDNWCDSCDTFKNDCSCEEDEGGVVVPKGVADSLKQYIQAPGEIHRTLTDDIMDDTFGEIHPITIQGHADEPTNQKTTDEKKDLAHKKNIKELRRGLRDILGQ